MLHAYWIQNDVENNIRLLREKDEELRDALNKMENRSCEVNIDDAVLPTAPLYKQWVYIMNSLS